MKVSIITVCFNSAQTLQGTIDSVILQDYTDIEYIVVDGGSVDGTKELIMANLDYIDKYISEPDEGIYDAMNKGLKLASGDVIGFINADDFLASSDCISSIVSRFQASTASIVYGDKIYVHPSNIDIIQRYWRAGEYERKNYSKGWMPPHLSTYIKKEVYDKYGVFRLDLTIAADYELLLRFIYKNNVHPNYLPKVIAKMRSGGVSNHSIKNIIVSNLEVYKSWMLNGLTVPLSIIIMKPLRKIKQYWS